jgi:hypothetical protein
VSKELCFITVVKAGDLDSFKKEFEDLQLFYYHSDSRVYVFSNLQGHALALEFRLKAKALRPLRVRI